MPQTRTRLLLISDTHTIPPSPEPTQSTPYRTPLPAATILLHAGDITKVGFKSEHELMLSVLKAHPAALKIVIAGNHDITLDEGYYEKAGWLRHRYRTADGRDHLSALPTPSPTLASSDSDPKQDGGGRLETPAEIKTLYTNPAALKAGIRYIEEGTHTFSVPSTGARFTVYASPYTPEFCRWAFAYPRGEDRYNPSPYSTLSSEGGKDGAGDGGEGEGRNSIIPSYPGVDILLTHGPPHGILDQVVGSGESVGCEHLYRAVARARPALHVFGHIHEGYGGRRVGWDIDSGPQAGTGSETKKIEEVVLDEEKVMEEGRAYVDLSSGSERPLRRGEETLFVNASVVTVEYQALNAPWVLDLDLDVED